MGVGGLFRLDKMTIFPKFQLCTPPGSGGKFNVYVPIQTYYIKMTFLTKTVLKRAKMDRETQIVDILDKKEPPIQKCKKI